MKEVEQRAILSFLKLRVKLFEGEPINSLKSLAETAKLRNFSDGEVIIREAHQDDYLYIIRSGRCAVRSLFQKKNNCFL